MAQEAAGPGRVVRGGPVHRAESGVSEEEADGKQKQRVPSTHARAHTPHMHMNRSHNISKVSSPNMTCGVCSFPTERQSGLIPCLDTCGLEIW